MRGSKNDKEIQYDSRELHNECVIGPRSIIRDACTRQYMLQGYTVNRN